LKCSDVLRRLEAYWDDALTEAERAAFDAHLGTCPACRDLVEGRDLLHDLDDPELARRVLHEPPPLPADFTARVMARVEAERPRPFALLWPWLQGSWTVHQYASAAYALAATLVVVSLGSRVFLWSQATDRLAVWAAKGQAYWAAFQAWSGPLSERLLGMWHALTAMLY